MLRHAVSALATISAMLFLGGVASPAHAAPVLDTSYGGTGIVTAPPSSIVLADGSIITLDGAGLHRIDPAGAADTSFGGQPGTTGALVRTPDGRYMSYHWSRTSGTTTVQLSRYDAAGKLDPTFDGDGTRLVGSTPCGQVSIDDVQLAAFADGGFALAFTAPTKIGGKGMIPYDYRTHVLRFDATGAAGVALAGAQGECMEGGRRAIHALPGSLLAVAGADGVRAFGADGAQAWFAPVGAGESTPALRVRPDGTIWWYASTKELAPVTRCLTSTGAVLASCTAQPYRSRGTLLDDGSMLTVTRDGAGAAGSLLQRWRPDGSLDIDFGYRGRLVACPTGTTIQALFPAGAGAWIGAGEGPKYVRLREDASAVAAAPSGRLAGLVGGRFIASSNRTNAYVRWSDCGGAGIERAVIRWRGRSVIARPGAYPPIPRLAAGTGIATIATRDFLGRTQVTRQSLTVDYVGPSVRLVATARPRVFTTKLADDVSGVVSAPRTVRVPITRACVEHSFTVRDRAGNRRRWTITARGGTITRVRGAAEESSYETIPWHACTT